jgi:hypothetical protein
MQRHCGAGLRPLSRRSNPEVVIQTLPLNGTQHREKRGDSFALHCKLLHLAGQRVQGASDCAYVRMRQASVTILSPIDDPTYICQSAEMSAGRKSTGEVPNQDFSPDISVS